MKKELYENLTQNIETELIALCLRNRSVDFEFCQKYTIALINKIRTIIEAYEYDLIKVKKELIQDLKELQSISNLLSNNHKDSDNNRAKHISIQKRLYKIALARISSFINSISVKNNR